MVIMITVCYDVDFSKKNTDKKEKGKNLRTFFMDGP